MQGNEHHLLLPVSMAEEALQKKLDLSCALKGHQEFNKGKWGTGLLAGVQGAHQSEEVTWTNAEPGRQALPRK